MSTRFLYITDTHWGAKPGVGYIVQPRDPSKFEAIHQGLKQWLSQQDPPIDFIVHGGDVVNNGTREQIIHATAKLAELTTPNRPLYIGLGNHDLEELDSMANWRKHHLGMLPDESGSFAVSFPAFHLYMLAHHWNHTTPPHYWDRASGQAPLLDDQQRENFEAFAANADRPIVLAFHSPVQSIPPSQSGHDVELHVPDPAWRAYILSVIDRFPAITLVLTAHAHVHTLSREKQCVIAGTTAFFETPYEAKLITISENEFDLQTLSFGDLMNIPGEYNPEKAYAQGEDEHRSTKWSIKL